MTDLYDILYDPYWMKDAKLYYPLDDPDVWWFFFDYSTWVEQDAKSVS